VDFDVRPHNQVIPLAASEGQTPDEMYFGDGGAVAAKLAAAPIEAQEQRIEANCVARCSLCNSDTSSPALQLQDRRSRMS
jgi:hypothetical protein